MGTKIQNALFQQISNRFFHFKNSFLWFSIITNTFLQGPAHIPRQITKLAGLSLRSWKGPTSTSPYRKIKLATLKICLCHLVGLDFLGEWVLTVGKNPRRPSALFAWWKPQKMASKRPTRVRIYIKKFWVSFSKIKNFFVCLGFRGDLGINMLEILWSTWENYRFLAEARFLGRKFRKTVF